MIKYKIDVTKIDKSLLYQGKKGVYLNGVLFENRDGRNDFGDDGFIVQDVSKEQREAGQKGPIIGNWRRLDDAKPAQKAPPYRGEEMTNRPQDDKDFIPF
jgi:hypothetical protein